MTDPFPNPASPGLTVAETPPMADGEPTFDWRWSDDRSLQAAPLPPTSGRAPANHKEPTP